MSMNARSCSLAQLGEQVEDLRLHDDVERRCRLVEYQQPRVGRQCARDHDALALAAGQLVRVAARQRRREPDLGEQLGRRVLEVPAPVASRCVRSGSATSALAVIRGSSAATGCWKTSCTLAPSARARRDERLRRRTRSTRRSAA